MPLPKPPGDLPNPLDVASEMADSAVDLATLPMNMLLSAKQSVRQTKDQTVRSAKQGDLPPDPLSSVAAVVDTVMREGMNWVNQVRAKASRIAPRSRPWKENIR